MAFVQNTIFKEDPLSVGLIILNLSLIVVAIFTNEPSFSY